MTSYNKFAASLITNVTGHSVILDNALKDTAKYIDTMGALMDPKSAIERRMGTTQSKDDLSLDTVVVSKLGPISSTCVKSITYSCKDKFADIALTKEERKAERIAVQKRYNKSPEGIAARKRHEESPERIAHRKRWKESPNEIAWWNVEKKKKGKEIELYQGPPINNGMKPKKGSLPRTDIMNAQKELLPKNDGMKALKELPG